MSINENKKAFLGAKSLARGTTSWREYVTSEGFSDGSIMQDTKAMLVSKGYWKGTMSESLDAMYAAEGFRWFYAPDGGTNVFLLGTTYTTVIGVPMQVCFIGGNAGGTFRRILGSESFTMSLDSGATGNFFRLVGCTATIDGVAIVSETTPIPSDSSTYRIIVTPTVVALVERFGGLAGINKNTTLVLFGVTFGDASVHDYPVDDNSATIVNYGSGLNATVVDNIPGNWFQA
jgi:hypothetical protein